MTRWRSDLAAVAGAFVFGLMWVCAIALAFSVGGCAGVPIARRTYVYVGVGVLRVDRQDRATAVRAITVGLKLECQGATLGVASSYCASIPLDGEVAILEEGSSPRKHLSVHKLQGVPDEVFATARDR